MDDLQILRLAQVLFLTGMKRSTLYGYIADGMFPQPISLGPRCSGWLLTDVRHWIADRVAESRSQSATKGDRKRLREGCMNDSDIEFPRAGTDSGIATQEEQEAKAKLEVVLRRSKLTGSDLDIFAKLGIPPKLLAEAQIMRVTDAEARQQYGIRFDAAKDVGGIVFPYFIPPVDYRVTARVRRDHPEKKRMDVPRTNTSAPMATEGVCIIHRTQKRNWPIPTWRLSSWRARRRCWL